MLSPVASNQSGSWVPEDLAAGMMWNSGSSRKPDIQSNNERYNLYPGVQNDLIDNTTRRSIDETPTSSWMPTTVRPTDEKRPQNAHSLSSVNTREPQEIPSSSLPSVPRPFMTEPEQRDERPPAA